MSITTVVEHNQIQLYHSNVQLKLWILFSKGKLGRKKNYCKKCLWSSMSQDSSSTLCIQSMTQLLEVICDQDMFSKGDSNMNDRFLQLHNFFCLFQLVFFARNWIWAKTPSESKYVTFISILSAKCMQMEFNWEKKLSPCRQTTEAILKLNLKHPLHGYTHCSQN